MIASVYIKDGNIHIYNENRRFTSIGGLAYELGRPLLDFVCYESDRFDDAFSIIASALDYPFAYLGINEPVFLNVVRQSMTETQKQEIYVYFYDLMLMEFIYAFVESPYQAIMELESKIPGAVDKLAWTMDFEWPVSQSQFIQAVYADNEKRLYKAALDAVSLMSGHLRKFQHFIIHEIEVLLHYRKEAGAQDIRPIDYIEILDQHHDIQGFDSFYLEKPFRTFYGRVDTGSIEQLYEINSIEDLFRFEFVKMIEHDIFIKKCENCGRFFIPRRRADAEYCDRIFGDTGRKCSEVGAMLKYEKKVAENPILEMHKKAYRRFHSRVRNKKMTQAAFLKWSEEASRKRDLCLAGELAFDEFMEWLEQGRVRKARGGGK